MNVFLLEVHPSLCLASAVYQGLVQAHTELCQLHRATSVSHKLLLQQKLLHQALESWNRLGSPGASYGSQIQKDVGFLFLWTLCKASHRKTGNRFTPSAFLSSTLSCSQVCSSRTQVWCRTWGCHW